MAWYNSNWQKRVKVTIDATKVSSALTDFPLLITEANLPASFFDDCKADGSDIVVTSSDGTTKLSRELVDIDTVGDTLVLWVKVPSVSSTVDTDVYLYYEYASATETNDTTTWPTEYRAVWHMQEAVGSTLLDSTANNADETSQVGSLTNTTGGLGAAYGFPGTSGNSVRTTSGPQPASEVTIVAMAKQDTAADMAIYSASEDLSSPFDYGFVLRMESSGNTDLRVTGSTSQLDARSGASTTSGNWYFVGGSYESSSGTWVSRGGSSQATGTNAYGTIDYASATGSIGCTLASSALESFDGEIAEVQILDVAKDADWMTTTYNNWDSPSTFYSVGAVETEATNVTATLATLTTATAAPVVTRFLDPTIYDLAVMEDSPVGYWKLDEASGNAVDSSGNGFDLTPVGSPTYSEPALIHSGTSVSGLNDSNYFLRSSENGLIVTGDVSLEFWFQTSTTTPTNGYEFINFQDGNTESLATNALYLVKMDGSGNLIMLWEYGSGSNEVINFSHGAVPTNEPVHIAMVRDVSAKQAHLYINGSLVDTQSYTNDTAGGTTSDLTIGSAQSSNNPSAVRVDEVAVYDSALSAARMQAHYAAGAQSPTATAGALTTTAYSSTVSVVPNAVEVDATLVALTATGSAATVQADVDANITATAGALAVSPLASTVSADLQVSASPASLTLSALAASTNVAQGVDATAGSLALTPQAGEVRIGVTIAASSAAVVAAPQAAGVSVDRDISATSATMSLTPADALLLDPVDVTASASSLSLSAFPANVLAEQETNAAANVVALSLTPRASSVRVNAAIVVLVDVATMTTQSFASVIAADAALYTQAVGLTLTPLSGFVQVNESQPLAGFDFSTIDASVFRVLLTSQMAQRAIYWPNDGSAASEVRVFVDYVEDRNTPSRSSFVERIPVLYALRQEVGAPARGGRFTLPNGVELVIDERLPDDNSIQTMVCRKAL